MKKEFCVQVDVTMSGNVYVNASNEQEAMKLVREIKFTPNDLRNFYGVDLEIVDVEEE